MRRGFSVQRFSAWAEFVAVQAHGANHVII